MTRKGIKSWVITFGAIMLIITVLVIAIIAGVRLYKSRKKVVRR
jgi:hypothetical protein